MNDVKDRMKLGTAQPSMATHALRYQEKFGLSDIETAYAIAAPWAAGVGTVRDSVVVPTPTIDSCCLCRLFQ